MREYVFLVNANTYQNRLAFNPPLQCVTSIRIIDAKFSTRLAKHVTVHAPELASYLPESMYAAAGGLAVIDEDPTKRFVSVTRTLNRPIAKLSRLTFEYKNEAGIDVHDGQGTHYLYVSVTAE